MPYLARALCLGLLAGAAIVDTAAAQYYPPPPPPPRPYYDGPDHYRPRRPPPGGQCDAVFRSPYGRRHVICELYRPKPVGAPCVCAAPPPRPGYPPGPELPGRVIP
jgi:hypothetical protein